MYPSITAFVIVFDAIGTLVLITKAPGVAVVPELYEATLVQVRINDEPPCTLPLKRAFPDTSSFLPGAVVPMPIFPELPCMNIAVLNVPLAPFALKRRSAPEEI